ncbi:MAG: hypothetical protein WDN28_15435 [Chthoniobacter sp.]
MRDVIAQSFEMALPMRQPGARGEGAGDGFGAWLPLFTFLVKECGLSLAEARSLPVPQAYALLATARRNEAGSQGDRLMRA